MINNNFKTTVIFSYPSRNIGGAQLLFIRCAEFLCKNTNYNIIYIDYSDGFASNYLRNMSQIEIRNFEPGIKNNLPQNSVLIVPLSFIDSLDVRFILNETCNVLLWSIHPGNLTSKVKIRNLFTHTWKIRNKIGGLVANLCKTGAIKFMDYNNYIAVANMFNFKIDQRDYLPIPIDDVRVKEKNIVIKNVNSKIEKVKFMWLSRLDADKSNTLVTAMNELSYLSEKMNVALYVIGDGRGKDRLLKISKKYGYPIFFKGQMSGLELDEFIDHHIDIGIAMGTSALEIAKRGKPVIVKGFLDKVYKANELKDYILLNEEFEYSLGSPDLKNNEQDTFSNKVIKTIDKYDCFAQKEYLYTVQNHTMSSVGRKLISAIEQLQGASNNEVNMNKIRDINYLLEDKLNLFGKFYRVVKRLR